MPPRTQARPRALTEADTQTAPSGALRCLRSVETLVDSSTAAEIRLCALLRSFPALPDQSIKRVSITAHQRNRAGSLPQEHEDASPVQHWLAAPRKA